MVQTVGLTQQTCVLSVNLQIHFELLFETLAAAVLSMFDIW